jgi:Flp pilus assembly protein TadG
MNKPFDRKAKSELGQSLVEFTLVAVVLAFMLTGLLDLGRAFFSKIALTDAAGEGATYASMRPGCDTDTGGMCADPNNVTYRVRHATESPLVDWNDVSVQIQQSPVISGMIKITVTASYNYTLLTPFVQSIVGNDVLMVRGYGIGSRLP